MVAAMFRDAGADIVHVSAGQVSKDEQPVYGRMFQVPFSDQIRNEVQVPTITVRSNPRLWLLNLPLLKQADDWLADLNFGSARQRVGSLIRKMHEVSGDGTAVLFGRDDMGAMTDLKLETVSREVSALVRAEVIRPLDKVGRLYEVLKPELL